MKNLLLIGLLTLTLQAENCKLYMNKADNFYTAAQQQTKYKMSEWQVQKLQQRAAYWRGRAIFCQNVKIQKQLKDLKKGK
jgi:hypothetical protein